MTVDGTITPAAKGENTLTFRLEYDGEPVTIEEVTIEARLPEQQLGPFSATPQFNPDTGGYEALLTMPVAGEWQIQVSARIDTYAQPIAIIPVTIDSTQVSRSPARTPHRVSNLANPSVPRWHALPEDAARKC